MEATPARAETGGAHLVRVLPCLVCIGWAGACATLLHLAPTRTEVAWVVVLAWGWGLTAILAAWLHRRRPVEPVWILLLAAAVRAVLVGTPPLLSDDVYRYLWEGRVLWAGANPFLHAPETLVGLDDALLARVNHAEVPSAYPPLGLAWFAVLSGLGGTVWGAQALTGLADLAIVGALVRGARLHGRGTWPALLYALHPLAALESAAGAHIDVPAAALLTWAVVLAADRSWLAPLLAVAGAGVKIFPVLTLPSLLWRAGWRRGLLGLTVGTAAVVLAALPVLSAGPELLAGLRTYATHWTFNGLVFTPLTAWLLPPDARRVLLVVGGLSVLIGAAVLRRRPAAQWLAVGIAFIALSPTVHPWYGLWMLVPALLLGRWGGAVAGLSLIGGYGVLSGYDAATGTWSEPAWLWAVTWVPALLALSVEGALVLRRLIQRRADSARV